MISLRCNSDYMIALKSVPRRVLSCLTALLPSLPLLHCGPQLRQAKPTASPSCSLPAGMPCPAFQYYFLLKVSLSQTPRADMVLMLLAAFLRSPFVPATFPCLYLLVLAPRQQLPRTVVGLSLPGLALSNPVLSLIDFSPHMYHLAFCSHSRLIWEKI